MHGISCMYQVTWHKDDILLQNQSDFSKTTIRSITYGSGHNVLTCNKHWSTIKAQEEFVHKIIKWNKCIVYNEKKDDLISNKKMILVCVYVAYVIKNKQHMSSFSHENDLGTFPK